MRPTWVSGLSAEEGRAGLARVWLVGHHVDRVGAEEDGAMLSWSGERQSRGQAAGAAFPPVDDVLPACLETFGEPTRQ